MADKKVQVPDVPEILKTGLQFGHSSSRWNPKMHDYIYATKNGVHVVDVVQTRELLQKAAEFIQQTAKSKSILFVASKRQAAEMVKDEAVRVGAHFVINRWPGGMFTNFDKVKKSLYRLVELEKMFEEGVEGRTKYEVVQLKNEWARLSRLYSGIKSMEQLPGAIVVIDPRFERVAVKEANIVGVPVVALTDTNCDPDNIDYIVPGNDDALKAIHMVTTVLADATLAGNEGKGVKHNLKDYSDVDVELKKVETEEDDGVELATETALEPKRIRVTAAQLDKAGGKGILEKVQDKKSK